MKSQRTFNTNKEACEKKVAFLNDNSIYSAKHPAKITWSRQSAYNRNKTSSKNDTKIPKAENVSSYVLE